MGLVDRVSVPCQKVAQDDPVDPVVLDDQDP
jgi:hypothetical protein